MLEKALFSLMTKVREPINVSKIAKACERSEATVRHWIVQHAVLDADDNEAGILAAIEEDIATKRRAIDDYKAFKKRVEKLGEEAKNVGKGGNTDQS